MNHMSQEKENSKKYVCRLGGSFVFGKDIAAPVSLIIKQMVPTAIDQLPNLFSMWKHGSGHLMERSCIIIAPHIPLCPNINTCPKLEQAVSHEAKLKT